MSLRHLPFITIYMFFFIKYTMQLKLKCCWTLSKAVFLSRELCNFINSRQITLFNINLLLKAYQYDLTKNLKVCNDICSAQNFLLTYFIILTPLLLSAGLFYHLLVPIWFLINYTMLLKLKFAIFTYVISLIKLLFPV